MFYSPIAAARMASGYAVRDGHSRCWRQAKVSTPQAMLGAAERPQALGSITGASYARCLSPASTVPGVDAKNWKVGRS